MEKLLSCNAASSSDLDSPESGFSDSSGFARSFKVDLDRNGAVFSESVYDVPTTHGIRPLGQRPVVRNVPIRIEGREETAVRNNNVVDSGATSANGASRVGSGGKLLADELNNSGRRQRHDSGGVVHNRKFDSLRRPSVQSLRIRQRFGVDPMDNCADDDLYDVPCSSSKTVLFAPQPNNGGESPPPPTQQHAIYAQLVRRPVAPPQSTVATAANTDILVLFGKLKSCVDQLAGDQLQPHSGMLADVAVRLLNDRCGEASMLLQQCLDTLLLSMQDSDHCSSSSLAAVQSSARLMNRIFGSAADQSTASGKLSLLNQFVGIARHALDQLTAMLSSPSTKQPQSNAFEDYDFVENVVPTFSAICSFNDSQDDDDDEDYRIGATSLSADNLEILKFYAPQIRSHVQRLNSLIDEVLTSIESNQPPRIFIGQIKFVVLTAHKLVYIGDSIALCVYCARLGSAVRQRSNRLCQNLRSLVASAKQAAQNYPAVQDVQAMIKCIVTVSKSAQQLRVLIDGVIE